MLFRSPLNFKITDASTNTIGYYLTGLWYLTEVVLCDKIGDDESVGGVIGLVFPIPLFLNPDFSIPLDEN